MINFFKFIKNLINPGITPEPKEGTILVPTEILSIGWMYPVLRDLMGNNATGEIRKFEDNRNKKVGQGLILNRNREVWVYLGQNYFKNIVKL